MFSRLADGPRRTHTNTMVRNASTAGTTTVQRHLASERNACGLDETHSLINMPNQAQYPCRNPL